MAMTDNLTAAVDEVKAYNEKLERVRSTYNALSPEKKQKYAHEMQARLAQEAGSYINSYNYLENSFRDQYGKQGYKTADEADKYAARLRQMSSRVSQRARKYADIMDIYGADMDEDFRTQFNGLLDGTRTGMYQLNNAARDNAKYYGQFADENDYNLYLDYQAHPEKYRESDEPVYYDNLGREVDVEKDPKWKVKYDYENSEAEVERLEQEKREYELDYQEWQRSFTAESRKYGADPETRASNPEYQQFVAEWDAEDARRQAEYDDYDARIAEAEARAKELEKEYDEAWAPYKDARKGLKKAWGGEFAKTLLLPFGGFWQNPSLKQAWDMGKYAVGAIDKDDVKDAWEYASPAVQEAAKAYAEVGGDPNATVIGAGVGHYAAPFVETGRVLGELIAPEHDFSGWVETADKLQDTSDAWLADQTAGRNGAGTFIANIGDQAVPLGIETGLRSIPYVGKTLGTISFLGRSFGSGAMEARRAGASLEGQVAYGALSAAIEGVTEAAFGELGKGFFGTAATDRITNHFVGKLFKTKAGQNIAKVLVAAFGEGLEEVMSDVLYPAAKSVYNGKTIEENYREAFRDENGALDFSDTLYSFAMGATLGGLGGGATAVKEMTVGLDPETRYFIEAGASGVSFKEAHAEWLKSGLDNAKALGSGETYNKAIEYEERLNQGKRVSEKKIEKLNARAVKELSNADIANTSEAVQKRLAELGVSDPDLARAITAAALAPEAKRVGAKDIFVTAAQQKLIQNSPVAQQVLAEMNVNALRTEQIRQIFGAETDGTMDNSWAKTGIRGNRLLASDVYGTERAVSSPEIGKATVNGEDVQIVGVQDGKIRIKQGENISSVAVKDISNISDDYHTLLEAAASREDGDTMLRAYRPGQIISSYVQAWTLASELYGANTSLTPAQARDMYPSLFRTLTDTQLELAMKSGAKAAAAKTEKRNAEIKEAKGKASEEAETKGEVKRKKGTVSYDGGKVNGKTVKGVDKSKFTRQQKAISAMVETLADVVNIDYVFFDGDPNTGGAYTQGGKIYLNINSGLLANKALGAATLSHEITHFLQDYAPEEYNELKDFITSEILKKSPEEFNKLVERQLALEPNLSFTDAVNEVVANACQKMLLNSKAITELARQNMKLAEKITDVIEEISGKIKAAFADVDINDNIGVYAPARAIEGFVDEVQKRWDRALKAAVENYNAEQATGKKNTAENGGVQYMALENMLTEKDLDNYLKTGSRNNKNKIRALQEGKKIILTSPAEIIQYIRESIKRGRSNAVAAYGRVDNRLASDILDESNSTIDISGKYLELNPYDLQHSYDEHHLAKEPGDIDLSEEDFENIPSYLESYDEVLYARTYSNGEKSFCVSKQLATGRIMLIEIVSKSRNAVQFKNAIGVSEAKYVNEVLPKYGKSPANTGGSQSSNSTPPNAQAFSNNSIAEEATESNTQNQQNQKFDSSDELQTKYDSYIDVGKELTDVRNQIRTWKNTADFKRIMDDIEKAKGDAIQDAIQAYKEWEDASGFGALYEREKELSDRYDRLRKEYEAMSLENEKEIEREQMEKSGKSEGDFFRDKAVKEFGYTPYYYDAGYIVPNGKMLNFSGEKGKHYGSRGQDHRAIGTIFASDISGSEAMLKFMGQGNIRIMAETPGIDISKDVEPTKEQYAQIRKFAAAYAKEEFFGVDFTDERGNTIGSLEYDGRVRPDRVINDIKHFYETGEVRDQGISQFYQKWGIGEAEAEQQARAESISNLKAENKILRERADYWKAQTRVSKEHLINRKDTDRLANALLKEYTSRADKDSVKEKLKALGDWLVQNKDISYDELYEKAREIADDITSESYGVIDDSQTEQLSMLKDYLKSTPLNLTAADFRDTGDEGFRKRYGRYFTVSENGRGIDSAWGELAAMFGEGLFPEDTYAPGDMLNMIGDYLDLWKPRYGNPLETYGDEILDYATNQIIEAMLSADIREAPKTFADKALEKLWRQQAKDKAKLDALREQKNARIEQIKREAAEKNRQIRIAEKAAKYEAVSKVKQHYQDMIKGQRARRSDTKIRGKIKDLHKELTNMLLKPGENRYVPKSLVKATAEILDAVDITTGKPTKASEAFAALRSKYDALKTDEHYSAAYDETVSGMLQKLAETVGDGNIYDLTGNDLEAVYTTLKVMKHIIQTANKLVGAETEKAASEIALQMISETRSAKEMKTWPQRFYSLAVTNPRVMFNVLGNYRKNSAWSQVYDMLNKGQLTQTQILMEGGQIFRSLIDDKRVDTLHKHGQKDLVDIGLADSSGNSVKVTRGMMLSIYMHLLNEQNAKHIMYGGLTVPRFNEYYGNLFKAANMKEAYKGVTVRAGSFSEEMVEINRQLREAETQEEIDALNERLKELKADAQAYLDNIRTRIEKELNDYDRAWIQAAQSFFDDYSKRKLNEVTEMVYGFQKAQVDNYFPIHTDPDYRTANFESIARDMSLENAGFMKERINGSNPILLEDITDVLNNQLRRTAQYVGLMPAIRNFNKVYGKSTAGYGDSVQKAVGAKFHSTGTKAIENLMADLNGARYKDPTVFDSIRGNVAASNLTINPRVTLAQVASYPTAAAEIGYAPLIKALKDVTRNPIFNAQAAEEVAKWTPLWWYRMQGYSNAELGDIKSNGQFMKKVMDKTKWLTGWIQFADGLTTGALWQASKYYVDENFSSLEKGSDEYMMKVAEVYNKVIERTQPDYTTMQRPDLLRSPNSTVKMLTMFMTQRLQNYSLLYDSAAQYASYKQDYKKGINGVTAADVKSAGTKLAWTVSSQLIAAATIVTFKLLADALLHNMNAYRDDDEELTGESVSKQLLLNWLESLASNVVAGSEIFSLLSTAFTHERYYGVSLNGISAITDTASDVQKLLDKTLSGNGEASRKAALSLAQDLSQILGIPTRNAIKIVNAVKYHYEDAKNGQLGSFEAGVERSKSTSAKLLYRALETGDTQRVTYLKGQYANEKEYRSAVKGYVKTLFVDEHGITRQKAKDALVKYVGMTPKEAEKTSLEWQMEADTGIAYGNLRDEYVSGHVSAANAARYIVKYGGQNEAEAEAKVREWQCERDTGIAYSDIDTEVKTGRLEPEKAIAMLEKYGGKDEDKATKTVEGWRIEHEYGISPDDLEEEYLAGNVSEDEALDILQRYKFYGKEDATERAAEEIEKYDFIAGNPGVEDITVTQVRQYKASGLENFVSPVDYFEALKVTNTFKGLDEDNDGRTDSYSVAMQKMRYIDEMDLTPEQKTALARALGISEKTIKRRAPWR